MTEPGNSSEAVTRPRRALFVSYYFPPSGGPGVQRTLKFAKYLPQFGWEVVVLTVDPRFASFPSFDFELEEEVPIGMKVIRTRAWDPYSIYARVLGKPKEQTVGVGFIDESSGSRKQAIGKWIRGNLFIPDARVGWVPFAKRAAMKLLSRERFDAVISTGPPHSAHLIGRAIARRGLPWLADFRDPWTGIDFYASLPMTRFSKRRDERLESEILAEADAVVGVTPGMVDQLAGKRGRPVTLIMNGYDPDDLHDPDQTGPIRFELSYVGNMNAARNPVSLWKAVRMLRDSTDDLGGFRIRLVGPIDRTVRAAIVDHDIADIVYIEPTVSHSTAVSIMVQSGLLLLVVNNVPGAEGIMTGKLFEYIGSGRPILGIGPVDGDAARALHSSGAGSMFDWDDVHGIAGFLREALDWSGQTVRASGADAAGRAAYSRINQARDLALTMNRLVIDNDG